MKFIFLYFDCKLIDWFLCGGSINPIKDGKDGGGGGKKPPHQPVFPM